MADVKKFLQNSVFQNEAPKKFVGELDYDDKRLFEPHDDGFSAIVAEKCYQGASSLPGVIQPIWAPVGEVSRGNETELTEKVPPDCTIMKSCFGTVTTLRIVLKPSFRWNRIIPTNFSVV